MSLLLCVELWKSLFPDDNQANETSAGPLATGFGLSGTECDLSAAAFSLLSRANRPVTGRQHRQETVLDSRL
ncbi:hypothetical protein A0U92_13490 [Acetobacter aceti]|uniref:Uncharacterized protein n=1 Tax=Acetobacter aceti TaxID=435 RepID=A0A1U9KIP6_ACEAC|nr:hypothetical protein A0U92_13490 [Acetobacter aceti]